MSTNDPTFHRARYAPCVAAFTGSVLAFLAVAINAQTMTDWDLPVQPLANSLRDVAARTDSNIIFDKKLVMGISAPALKTRATTQEVLTQLLKGTGLTYRQLDDRTVTIQRASAEKSTDVHSSDGRAQLAQTRTGRGPPSASETTQSILEEIFVTGSNIRGVENNTVPITVLTREDIDATGYTTTSKLLQSLTQNFALANSSGYLIPGVSNNNRDQGASVNLRGIGEGTTLVLVNGHRVAPGYKSAAVDVSALPLSAIERVEVMTDGASALYGSDAIGGVVNFILREDLKGAETRLRAGTADGVDEYRASQAVGNSWDTGHVLASVEYYQRDMLLPGDRDFVPRTVVVGSLAPEDKNYSVLLTGRQHIGGGSLELFGDALYTVRDSFNRGGRTLLNETTQSDNGQLAATLGVDWNVGGDWQIELAGSYARNDIDQFLTNSLPTGLNNNVQRDSLFTIESGELKADGTLFELPGGNVGAAFGIGYRDESYEDIGIFQRNGLRSFSAAADQSIRSAFGEVYVPFFGEDNAIVGVRALELSLGGRYDDYSTAGSSFDPQAGLMWEPIGGLRLRARYSTSYKAPNLVDYTFAANSALAGPVLFPAPLYIIQVQGTDVNSLRPQQGENVSFGVQWAPPGMPGWVTSLNYYKIRYIDLVATPANQNTALALANPEVYRDVIYFNPSVDLVNEFVAIGRLGRGFSAINANGTLNPNFDPTMVQAIVDLRRRNLSLVHAEGVDLETQYVFDVGSSALSFGVTGTYILKQDQQVTDTAPALSTVDTIYNPPDWRARGFVGWEMHGWSANMFVNHTDSYLDGRFSMRRSVDSYTTVDMRVAYDFSARFNSGLLSGLSIALSAQNVADEAPPSTVLTSASDVGYDATNADPLGRLISLEISKTW